MFIQAGLIYKNGIRTCNSQAAVYVGDCVQIHTSTLSLFYDNACQSNKFFITREGLILRQFLTFYRLRTISELLRNTLRSPQAVSCNFAKLNLVVPYLFDIPNYLEVDFHTSSIFVLYSPIFFFELNPLLLNMLPLFAMRVYN